MVAVQIASLLAVAEYASAIILFWTIKRSVDWVITFVLGLGVELALVLYSFAVTIL